MDVSVRKLRNETASVIEAVEAGTPVTLTVHGKPVADIVPRAQRQERRPTSVVMRELAEVAETARAGQAQAARSRDYDSGLTTDDFQD